MNTRWRAVTLLAAAALTLAACSTPTAGPSNQASTSAPSTDMATRTSEGGQVTVVATWAGPAAGATVAVTLDTHSVDLDALDLATAVLRNDRGQTLSARPWAAPKGGHHRSGNLTFDGDAGAFLTGARWVELVLTGIGDLPERTLRWDVGP
ncbi:MAG: hypothetical protein ABI555_02440 [Chloroflexota bacterium]